MFYYFIDCMHSKMIIIFVLHTSCFPKIFTQNIFKYIIYIFCEHIIIYVST